MSNLYVSKKDNMLMILGQNSTGIQNAWAEYGPNVSLNHFEAEKNVIFN